MFAGYKTYVTAAVTIMGAVFALYTGQIDLATATEFVVTSVLAMTVRHGIKTGA